MNIPCPECGGRSVRIVSLRRLRLRAERAGLQLVPWPATPGIRYWWCDRCRNGGAFQVW